MTECSANSSTCPRIDAIDYPVQQTAFMNALTESLSLTRARSGECALLCQTFRRFDRADLRATDISSHLAASTTFCSRSGVQVYSAHAATGQLWTVLRARSIEALLRAVIERHFTMLALGESSQAGTECLTGVSLAGPDPVRIDRLMTQASMAMLEATPDVGKICFYRVDSDRSAVN